MMYALDEREFARTARLKLERAVMRDDNLVPLCLQLFGEDVGADMLADIRQNAFGQ